MNILIVDDDTHMVRSIQKNVDWGALGIDTVHAAGSARQAKGVLSVYPVDVLLCDIEMPQQSGLDLLEWVRAQRMDVQALFLTSYANFEYARRAIELESVEYFLKPVDYGALTGGISRAVERVRRSREAVRNRDLGERWMRGRGEVAAHFWRQVLGGLCSGDAAAVRAHLEEGLLPYAVQSRFVPALVRALDGPGALDGMSPADLERGLRCRCAPLLRDPGALLGAFALAGDEWMLILSADGMAERPSMAFIARLREWLGVELLLGLGEPCFIHEVYQSAQDLRAMLADCVCPQDAPLRLRDWAFREAADGGANGDRLKALLDGGDVDGFEREALAHLASLGALRPINAGALRALRLDLIQAVCARLEQAGVQARTLFSDETSERLYAQAAASTSGMAAYIRHLAAATARHVGPAPRRERGVVDRLVDYIDANCLGEINRSELAKSVYLNPDYISRLFKRETGRSISGYIIKKRMDAAKALLRGGDTPIHAIASQVGYDSFAYFSKIFKQVVGVTPNEYRHGARGPAG